jgi:hypothetical protein
MPLTPSSNNPGITIICLQQPGISVHGSAPNHPSFQVFTQSPKPIHAIYVRTRNDTTAPFAAAFSFVSLAILRDHSRLVSGASCFG